MRERERERKEKKREKERKEKKGVPLSQKKLCASTWILLIVVC